LKPSRAAISAQIAAALEEDIGSGDVSAELIRADRLCTAHLITRQGGVLAGTDWVAAVFEQLSPEVQLEWQVSDGDRLRPDHLLCIISGPARAVLSGERTALNFLQLLSGIATRTGRYVQAVAGTRARILDTRKTLPGLRSAQKYAVTVGGGHNHRMGLYDMVMLKENHIAAAGGIADAIKQARTRFPNIPIEVEVEGLDQLDEALSASPERIMLDNFTLDDLRDAVQRASGKAILEASGGITLETIGSIAATGVDEISVGELTKNIEPLDLSLRVVD
jgi:nicotinate-nucleotide pyrophosphorylase (carboxylating)